MQTKKILISVEDRNYEVQQRNKGKMQERLNKIGYRPETDYADYVSFLAW